MDNLDPFAPHQTPTAKRPLLGMIVLVVEDSRFASEALRLMCLRSGARIRRADCLRSARRHLQVYRPSVVIIDLGLPDGSGLELIEELNRAAPRVGVILAISGDEHAHNPAIAAGADGFLAKPLDGLGVFQQAIVGALPPELQSNQLCAVSDEVVVPDPVAYRDDMSHVANLLDDHQDGSTLDYVAQFLASVAKSADDGPLGRAAEDLARACEDSGVSRAKVARLAGMVQERLGERIAI
ncbi:response regulator [Roseovarius sp. 2305UL8-3]|uniref:response regulator n=1 Tax=Roseovarius conchicola TaxID=3121636 RepID=UPI003527CF9B